jgi:ribosomal protein S18 acetylase RimI-like enzyme
MKSSEHVYISGLVVHTDYQGRGIATQAMKQILANFSDVARIDLVTHPKNPALGLYQELGFKIEKLVDNYWGEGKPRLVLSLTKSDENVDSLNK